MADDSMLVTIPSNDEIMEMKRNDENEEDDGNTKDDHEHEYNNSCDEMDAEAKARYELYLKSKNDNLIRIDITSTMFHNMDVTQRNDYVTNFSTVYKNNVKTIHLSGHLLSTYLTAKQVENLVVNGIGKLSNLTELFIFHGQCIDLTEDIIAKCIMNSKQLKVLMLWQFYNISSSTLLPASFSMHHTLERITINLPKHFIVSYGCFDIYTMAFANMKYLRVLQIRCHESIRQRESLISPEALILLVNSKSITSLYLENIGLIDDHIDAIADEFMTTKDNNTDNNHTNITLKSIDLKDNIFSNDILYTFGNILKYNTTLQNIDISGVHITNDAGIALSNGILHHNNTLLHIELEGVYDNYKNEFNIPDGHKYDSWMLHISYQLRINRAYHSSGITFSPQQSNNNSKEQQSSKTSTTNNKMLKHTGDVGDGQMNEVSMVQIEEITLHHLVDAIIHVSDHLGCIYYLLRQHHTLYANRSTKPKTYK